MKILVCGGRNVGRTRPIAHRDSPAEIARATKERSFVTEYLTKLHSETPITAVVGGNEGGAERLGVRWAEMNSIPVDVWERRKDSGKRMLAKTLGLFTRQSASVYETMEERNARMLAGSKPDLVVAFGGGDSTVELTEAARREGIRIIEVQIPE